MNSYDKIGWRMELTNTISNCIVMFILGMIICSIL